MSWHSPAKPVLIFTDASYESGKSGIGAVLVDTLGGRPEVYDGEIPADIVGHWQSVGQDQIISQAELAVVVIVRRMFQTRLAGRRVIYFIDNEAARHAILKGTSGKDSMQRLTAAFHAADLHLPSIAWVERVPSDSNRADAPSRGKASECAKTLGGIYAGKMCMPEEVHQAIKSSLVQTSSLSGFRCPVNPWSCCLASLPEKWAVDGASEASAITSASRIPRWKMKGASDYLHACSVSCTCDYIQLMRFCDYTSLIAIFHMAAI